MFHITIYYRTATQCNTWMVSIAATGHEDAMTKARGIFSKRRPRAIRIDRVECIGEIA